MEVNSVQNLCNYLITCAIRRCRISEDFCRLSISVKSSPQSTTPLLWISVSDTGVGSTLEEFLGLKFANDPIVADKWDGVICVATTSISDKEIHHFKVNLTETDSSRRMTKLHSVTKNGAKFSGTEVSLWISENIDDLLRDITFFLRKMLVLKAPVSSYELFRFSMLILPTIPALKNVLTSDFFFLKLLWSQCESHILQLASSSLPSSAPNIDQLKSGFEEYVSKHGNILNDVCHRCFSTGSREYLKVGSGVACSTGNQRSNGQVMEVVIIVSEIPETTQSSCFRAYDKKTEILYFKDYSPCSISQSSLDALTSIKWKDYGLTLRSIAVQDGCTLLEWQNLPPFAHIDIVLHSYHKQVLILPCKESSQVDQSLTRKAVKLALNELKEKNGGVLLSERALKICNYAPDLAKTIAGLILSSHDLSFKGECISLLGLQFQEITRNVVEDCIKEKIISAIGLNDIKPQRTREAASFLFDDEVIQELDTLDEEYEECEEAFGS
ncbi:unnamed protein product [Fraxinus pennsylvanica]|uniref:Type 2 DNA topoisomerase 6 subunit B-like n=1 Tax=Fraxinus pennsylvanica TaxID=56036 RepID=A0AAD1ZTK8_9LAMI|nr:unnamed protein product [Fraxinus pennsylvanica]